MPTRRAAPLVNPKKTPPTSREINRGALLLRFRTKNSPMGVTRSTLMRAAADLGMNETQLVHLALRSFIRENLPSYDVDAPELTAEQIEAVRRQHPQPDVGKILSNLCSEA